MPLIFAIDNDKRQSAQLASLLRTEVEADLVQSASASEGLAILQDRIPDLILTSTFLSPRDESALASYLRELGGRGAHVQTLTIPVLATGPAGPKKKKAGMLGALRRGKTVAILLEGCLPDAFAKEVQQYLNRAIERRIAEPEAGADVLGLMPEPTQEAESWPSTADAAAVVPEMVEVVPERADVLLPPIAASVVTITSPVIEIAAPAVVLVKPAADVHGSAAATTAAIESSPFLRVETPPEQEFSGWSLLTEPRPEPVVAPVVVPLIVEATNGPTIEAPAIDAADVAAPLVAAPFETRLVETRLVETSFVETSFVHTPFAHTPLVETPVVDTPPVVELAAEAQVETAIAETPDAAATSDSILLARDDSAPGVAAEASIDAAQAPVVVEGPATLLEASEPAWVNEPAPLAEAVSSEPPEPVFVDAPAAVAAALPIGGEGEAEPVLPEPVAVEPLIVEPLSVEPLSVEPAIIEPVVFQSAGTEPIEADVTAPALAESTPAAEVSGPGDLYLDSPEPVVDGAIADLAPAAAAAQTQQVDGHVPVVEMAKPDDLDTLASSLGTEQSLFIPEDAGVPEVPASVFLKDAPPLDPSIFMDAPEPVSTPLIEQPYAGLAFEDVFLSAADRKRALTTADAPESEAVSATVAAAASASVEPASIEDLFVPLAAAEPVEVVSAVEVVAPINAIAPIEVAEEIEVIAPIEAFAPAEEIAAPEVATAAEVAAPLELVARTDAVALNQPASARTITPEAGECEFQAAWDEMTRVLEPPMTLRMPEAREPEPPALAPEAPAGVEAAPPSAAAIAVIDEPTDTAAAVHAVEDAPPTPVAIEATLPSWSWIERAASRPLADILAAVVHDSDSDEAAKTAIVAVARPEAVAPVEAVTTAEAVASVEAEPPVEALAEQVEAVVAVEAQTVEAVAPEAPAATVVAAEPVAAEPVADKPTAEAPLAAVAAEPPVAEPVAVVHEVFNADAAASWNAAVMFGAAPIDAPSGEDSLAAAEQAAAAEPAAPEASDAYDPVNAAAWRSVMAGHVEEGESIPAPPALDEWGGHTGPVLGEEFLALIGSAARQASLDAFDALAEHAAPRPPLEPRERPRPRPSGPSPRATRAAQERTQRRTKRRPVQDEWGMFDPAQAGPDALFDEDAWEEEPDGRRPSPRGRTAA